ncbi:MAG: CotS family spore coat protein [Betaproteobacteria bacterium]
MRREVDLAEIAAIASRWGISPLAVEPVRAAYRVACSEGVVALKRAKRNAGRFALVDRLFHHLEGQGFLKTAPFLPTLSGKPFCEWDGDLWTVTPWRQGREPQYRIHDDIARCADTLAEFHRAASGFRPPPGLPLRSSLGKWPKKLRRKADALREHLRQATAAAEPDEFQLVFRHIGPWAIGQLDEAVRKLAGTAYAERCAWAAEASSLCHGDPSDRNFILGSDGVPYLIDLDSVKLDLPETDLARLLRRTMRRTRWDAAMARSILRAYETRSPLGREARDILCALLQYPEQVYRLTREYGEAKARSGQDSATVILKLARKLRQVCDDRFRCERFWAEFP